MAAKQVIIFGAGGHGSELYSYIRDLAAQEQEIHVVGFVDEHRPRDPASAIQILGNLDDLEAFLTLHAGSVFHYITAVGDNQTRRRLVEKVENLDAPNLASWILCHPRASVGHDVEIGEGTCLAPGSIVTTHVRIGKHCIINVNASLSHDTSVEDFTNINPGVVVAGNVKIGRGCFIGAGATLIEKVSIGDWTVIGAGAVVADDIPPHVTAVGVPARVIKRHDAP